MIKHGKTRFCLFEGQIVAIIMITIIIVMMIIIAIIIYTVYMCLL